MQRKVVDCVRAIFKMSKSTKIKALRHRKRQDLSSMDTTGSLNALQIGISTIGNNMINFERGCHKFIKDINKIVFAMKQKVSLSPLSKELDFVQNGLSNIQDLTLNYRMFAEKHFRMLEITPQNLSTAQEQSEPLLAGARKPRTTSFIAPEGLSSSKQVKRQWEGDAEVLSSDESDSIKIYPKTSETATSKSLKRPCEDVDFPDSAAMSLLLEPPERNFSTEDEWVTVFIDGACSDNGKNKAKAGVGVWFYANCPFNVAEPVRSNRNTNNVAEIEASIRAIEQAYAAGIKKLRVKTDSMFLINCITKWRFAWLRNGWKTANGKPVINKPELEQLAKVMKMLPVEIDWVHVKAHSGIIGNEAADFLARQGAEKCSK